MNNQASRTQPKCYEKRKERLFKHHFVATRILVRQSFFGKRTLLIIAVAVVQLPVRAGADPGVEYPRRDFPTATALAGTLRVTTDPGTDDGPFANLHSIEDDDAIAQPASVGDDDPFSGHPLLANREAGIGEAVVLGQELHVGAHGDVVADGDTALLSTLWGPTYVLSPIVRPSPRLESWLVTCTQPNSRRRTLCPSVTPDARYSS